MTTKRTPAAAEPRELAALTGASAPMVLVRDKIRRLGKARAPVAIRGESGTGKELVARALHACSARAGGPFVAINCATLVGDTALTQLFGAERGSFTGATARLDGAFHRAHGGTLFLDEVAELSPLAQVQLLRVTESQEVARLNGAPERLDVRIVCASHADLAERCATHAFRPDLYARLNVLIVELPPLRARLADVPDLARHLSQTIDPAITWSGAALALLLEHTWPLNVRELRGVVERAHAECDGGPTILPEHVLFDGALQAGELATARTERERRIALRTQVLHAHQLNASEAARELGVSRSTLTPLRKQLMARTGSR